MSAPANVTPIRPATSSSAQVFLSPEQVCNLVPVLTPRDLEDMRSNNTGPAYSRPTPRKVVYLEADLHAWVQSKRHATREQS